MLWDSDLAEGDGSDPIIGTETPAPNAGPSSTPPIGRAAVPPETAHPAPGRWQQLKEHKVIQWTLVYAAAAYTLLHGAEMLSDAQEWPRIIVRVFSLALILGVPIVATLAWFHGHRAQHRVSGPEIIILTVLLFVTGSILWWLSRVHVTNIAVVVAPSVPAEVTSVTPSAAPDKSVAVLPFADMSEKKDQEYFADGIAEEVLDRLAKVPGLKVVGHESSFQFKGTGTGPGGIGAALGVSYLLEGSVRRDGERVRVTAQLIDARNGSQKWSDHFDSQVVDVLQVQDTIATGLARELQIAVEADTAPRASIKSPEALDAYLRGLQSLDRDTQESAEAAVAQFQLALSLDPTFAPAAIDLARAYVYIGELGWLAPRVAFERAREAAMLAQRLDPKSPLPRVFLAEIHIVYDWDWAGADRELQQAFALGPRDTYGAQVASWLAAARGHWEEARQLAIQSIALDPLNANAHGAIGFQIYLRSGNLTEAERSLRRALQIAPEYATGHYFLGETLMLQGHLDAALAEFSKETLDDGQLEGSAMAQFAAGRKADSDAQLAKAIRHNGASWASEIARVYAFRGEKDHAFEWLDRAYEARDEDLYFMKADPLFKNLEGDPRYRAFLRRMNLPE
ncbi:MAG TPA: tetratricopeptide repeat protein [Steroidobacteraceae bacterium]|nr:tetratricopeptide repeat protein [Steroidobacteraceae bacterium]